MQIGHPACAEILANLGYDWVCVDLEHATIGLEATADIFRALERFDCTSVARVPANDPVWIRRTLDAGARGVIVPMVNSAEEAKAAVRSAKYPPQGARGFGYSRANLHGMDFEQYIAGANDEIALVLQIEHKDAIASLDEIAAVSGVDALFIGPMDLSGSMGITGQMDHPDMTAALKAFRRACQAAGVPAGMHIVKPTPQNVRQALADGYTLIAMGQDSLFLEQGAANALRAATT